MHNNYYFLKRLIPALQARITGSRLISSFSQNKDELVLIFDSAPLFTLKAHLVPSFCCLSFPVEYHRARKNSVDLFIPAIDQQVTGVRSFLNERCFAICFDPGTTLLFKMHGNRSNVILFHAGQKQLFKSSLKNDENIDINHLDRALDQSYEAFKVANGDYKKVFPTFGPVIAGFLKENDFEYLELDDQWHLIHEVLKEVEQERYFIIKLHNDLHLSLINIGEVLAEFRDPIEALDSFFLKKISTDTLEAERGRALSQLNREIKKANNYIVASSKKLAEITGAISYSQLADVLMANLHTVDHNATQVVLPNFYNNNEPVKIKLKKDLSPQKNAEVYYRKSKNQAREVDMLTQNIEHKKEHLARLERQKQGLLQAENLKTVREIYRQRNDAAKETEIKPFRTQHFEGFDIWIGKNAKSNDEMLRNYSNKEDLWLHAKDVSGSHVLIKHRPGQVFPGFVIERAAELAAYHSKRKQDTVCPVIYTPRKFVRKRKGDPPGAVIVERENVILIKPSP
ncbi:MAG: NFACT RNA binding domain-containing protein [Cytophagales bacterium]|nr:NFACT RNA binding domain-containing protein [Cytophagales bacterium]